MLNLFVIWKGGPNGHERQYSLPQEKKCGLMEAVEFKLSFRGNAGDNSFCIPEGSLVQSHSGN